MLRRRGDQRHRRVGERRGHGRREALVGRGALPGSHSGGLHGGLHGGRMGRVVARRGVARVGVALGRRQLLGRGLLGRGAVRGLLRGWRSGRCVQNRAARSNVICMGAAWGRMGRMGAGLAGPAASWRLAATCRAVWAPPEPAGRHLLVGRTPAPAVRVCAGAPLRPCAPRPAQLRRTSGRSASLRVAMGALYLVAGARRQHAKAMASWTRDLMPDSSALRGPDVGQRRVAEGVGSDDQGMGAAREGAAC